MQKLSLPNLILALSVAMAPTAYAQQSAAQQPGSIELKNIAEIEVKTTDAKGKVAIKRMPADKAIPGTEVIYTTTFKNIGDQPVGNIVINNPLPRHTTLVADSIFGTNTDITYAVDGKNFAPPNKLTVKDQNGKDITATTKDYTHIRWSFKGDLEAGKSGQVGFRAKVN
ncbi:MAG: hypothetical protein ABL860_05265 [Candidatus Nitrotoga sp.]